MANHKATKKDTRQANKRRERNRYHGKTTRNAMRDLMAITDENAAKEKLPTIEGMLDKLAKKNIIHKNKAANLKSALAKRVAALGKVSETEVIAKPAKKAAAKKTGAKKTSKK